jgi:hypothetical protein
MTLMFDLNILTNWTKHNLLTNSLFSLNISISLIDKFFFFFNHGIESHQYQRVGFKGWERGTTLK